MSDAHADAMAGGPSPGSDPAPAEPAPAAVPAGSAPAHAAPAPAHAAPAPAEPALPQQRGTVAWALGFLAYIPIPVVNVLIVGAVQVVVGLAQRKHGGLAAVNGVRAANWGLTQLCYPILLAITVTVGLLTGTPSGTGGVVFHPAMNAVVFTVLGLWFVVGILELVYGIVGTVQAHRGRRVRLPVIPFLRAPRDGGHGDG